MASSGWKRLETHPNPSMRRVWGMCQVSLYGSVEAGDALPKLHQRWVALCVAGGLHLYLLPLLQALLDAQQRCRLPARHHLP